MEMYPVNVAHRRLAQHLCPLGWVRQGVGRVGEPRLRQAPMGEKGGGMCRARVVGARGWRYSPVRDVGGSHHGGDVHHGVADHAGVVGVGELAEEVARQEAPV